VFEEKPEGAGNLGGDRGVGGAKHSDGCPRIAARMNALEAGRLELAPARQLDGRRESHNDRRARAADEAGRLGGGMKPLKGESRTWLRGETNPQGMTRRKPSRA
jgi:hypothetical protein